jgi:phosphoribosylanthranilate isomerase
VDAPKSPRNLSLMQAKRLMKRVPPLITRVAVTVFESEERLKKIETELNPDLLQVNGGDTSRILRMKLLNGGFPMIRALDLRKSNSDGELDMASEFEGIVLDSSSVEGYGGTGKTQDWKIAKSIREKLDPTCVILSGGLTPQNVRQAISTVRPYAVDVASGVERAAGIKDPGKVRQFIAEAKRSI